MLEATKSEESGANEKDATKAVLSVVEGVLELAELMKVRRYSFPCFNFVSAQN